MTARRSLLRNFLLLAALAASAPLLRPGPASAQEDGCVMQGFDDGSFCVGCRSGGCWEAACYDPNDGSGYSDGGCAPGPIYA